MKLLFKHSVAGLICLLLVFQVCTMDVFAKTESTGTISVQVPEKHTLSVEAEGAQVFVDGIQGESFLLERHSTPVLVIRPDSGKRISQILFNDEDVTGQLDGGCLTLDAISVDSILQVKTVTAPAVSKPTVDSYTIVGTVTRNGAPVGNITVELRSTVRSTTTAADGSFRFKKVEPGWHTLTALEDGAVSGYAEFVLTEGTVSNLQLNDDGSYRITVPTGTTEVRFQLKLDGQKLILDSVTPVTPSKNNESSTTNASQNSVATGDEAEPLLYMGILMISGMGLFVTGRKRSIKNSGKK